MLIVEAIVLPTYSILYNVNLFRPGLIVVVLLGSIGYAAVGTLLASMAVQARARGRPVADPALPGRSARADLGRQSDQCRAVGAQAAELWPWLNLLIAYDVIFTAVAFMLFDFVVEE